MMSPTCSAKLMYSKINKKSSSYLARTLKIFTGLIFFLLFALNAFSQIPGQIYNPATTEDARLILDPNGDGFVSNSRLGFTGTADGASNMELPMIRVPYFSKDPTNDLATGSGGSQLDFIGSSEDNGAVYVLLRTINNVNYLMVRLRLGANASAGKAWGLLIDTDGEIQFSGRNPGFEKEVLLVTGSGGGVQVNNLTPGTTNVISAPRLTPLGQYHQRALASDGNVFYDYYVPLTDLGLTTSQLLRFVAVTVTNGTSAISGTVADVSGVDDRTYGNNTSTLLKVMGLASPLASLNNLVGLEGTQTSVAPAVNGPINVTATSISGTSVEAAGTTIEVFRNTSSIGSTTVNASNQWTLTPSGLTFAVGDLITAKATAIGKNVSPLSRPVTVSSSASCFVAAPVVGGRANGQRTFTVTWTSSVSSSETATIRAFYQTAPGAELVEFTPASTITSGSTLTITTGFSQNNFTDYTYFATATVGSCQSLFSAPSIGIGTTTTTPTVETNPITSSNEGVTVNVQNRHTSAATLILFRNSVEVARQTNVASLNNHPFTLPNPVAGERISARAVTSTTWLSNISTNVLVTNSVTEKSLTPSISGSYVSGSNLTVSGTSDEPSGTVIRLSRTVSGVTTIIGSTTVNGFGNWQITGLSLNTGDILTVVAEAVGKLPSDPSDGVTVAASIPAAPVISTTTIIASQTSTISGTGGSGTITVYLDGSPLGTTTGTSWSLTGYPVSDLSRGAKVTATNTVSGVESPLSNEVTVTGVANFLVAPNGTASTSVVAGDPFTVTITARDASNATFTSFNGFVTLTSTSAIGVGGGLIGPFVNGVLTNHSLSLLSAGNNQTIAVVNPEDPTANGTATIGVVAPNEAFQLRFAAQPGNAVAGETIGDVTVRVEDQYGNLRTGDSQSVTIGIRNNAGSGTLTGTITKNAINGVVDFTGLSINKSGTGYTLEASSLGLITSAASNAFNITAAAASKLVISTAGSPSVGEAFAATVTLTDQYGNAVLNTGSNGSVTLTLKTGTGTLGGTLTGTIAVGSSSVTISGVTYSKAETGVVLTATGSGAGSSVADKSGDSDAFTVQGGVATQLVLSSPADITAGVRTAYTVTRKDLGGNEAVTNEALTVYLFSNGTSGAFYDALTGGNAITTVSIPANSSSATFYFTATTAATYTITTSDATPANGATGLSDATDEIVVSAGVPSQLVFTNSARSIVALRTSELITIELRDANNNLAIAGSSGVTVSLSDGLSPARVTFLEPTGETPSTITNVVIANGTSSASFRTTSTYPGSYTLTANAGSGDLTKTQAFTVTNTAPLLNANGVDETSDFAREVTFSINYLNTGGSIAPVDFMAPGTVNLQEDDNHEVSQVKVQIRESFIKNGVEEYLIINGASTLTEISLATASGPYTGTVNFTLGAVNYTATLGEAEISSANYRTLVFTKASGSLSLAEAEALLDAIKYSNKSTLPDGSARRTFELTVTENVGDGVLSNSTNVVITVGNGTTLYLAPPSTLNRTVTYVEGALPVKLAADGTNIVLPEGSINPIDRLGIGINPGLFVDSGKEFFVIPGATSHTQNVGLTPNNPTSAGYLNLLSSPSTTFGAADGTYGQFDFGGIIYRYEFVRITETFEPNLFYKVYRIRIRNSIEPGGSRGIGGCICLHQYEFSTIHS
jgi:hypothetical protein